LADIPSPGIIRLSLPQWITMNRVIADAGAKYPSVQAPMGWIARTQPASAVSGAGSFG
jgi:enoyl-[acyl-carrier protein] reductase II